MGSNPRAFSTSSSGPRGASSRWCNTTAVSAACRRREMTQRRRLPTLARGCPAATVTAPSTFSLLMCAHLTFSGFRCLPLVHGLQVVTIRVEHERRVISRPVWPLPRATVVGAAGRERRSVERVDLLGGTRQEGDVAAGDRR